MASSDLQCATYLFGPFLHRPQTHTVAGLATESPPVVANLDGEGATPCRDADSDVRALASAMTVGICQGLNGNSGRVEASCEVSVHNFTYGRPRR